MNVQTDRALIPAGQPSIRYLSIAIAAPAADPRGSTAPTSTVAAPDARLIVAGATGIDIGCLSDLPGESVEDPATGHADAHVLLGDLAPAQTLTVVLAVRCPAVPAGGHAPVSLRLADRDHVLFPQPLDVEWQAVRSEADAAQPVNAGVLITAAGEVAGRARAAAFEMTRLGDSGQAAAILAASAADLRVLGAGIAEVRTIAAALETGPLAVKAPLSPSAPAPSAPGPVRTTSPTRSSAPPRTYH
jgi:hypothetical protein